MTHSKFTRSLTALAAAGLTLMMSACGGNSSTPSNTSASANNNSAASASDNTADDRGTKEHPIKIGVVGASDPQWPIFKAEAEKEGIYVEIINFTDYPQLNPALNDSQLDLNQFQHLKYLAAFNAAQNANLVAIGDTAIYPLGVYSKKYTDVKDIPSGSEVTIPNDPTNQARALELLQVAGLLKLKDGASALPTPADVDVENSKVKITAVDANNVVTAIDSVAATVVNNDYIADAGLKAKDAIYLEDGNQKGAAPYINIWAARNADKDNPKFKKLVEINKRQVILDAIQESADGSAVFTNKTPEELAEILAEQVALVSKQ